MPIYIPPLVKKIGVGTIPTGLNDLSDVIVSAPTSGQGLVYNGSYWVNADVATQAALDSLSSATAAATGSLQVQITSNDGDIASLQHQINELVTGVNIVFCEEFTGNGVATTAQLNGNITNGTFISGGWSAIEVANTLPSYITDLDGNPVYNSGNVFTRTRLVVSTINSSGLVSLNAPPQNSQQYKIWYFYSLSADDRLDDYYRDDFVAEMEEEASQTVLASQVFLNTAAFDGILNGTHTTAQAAFDAIDDHLHSQYTLLTTTADISGDLQSQINAIDQESTVVASSGGSIIVTQLGSLFNIEVASAPIQNHNLLTGLQGGTTNQYYHLTASQYAVISGGVAGIQGRYQLSNIGNTFTIPHSVINEASDFPVASLEVASSGSDLFIVGIHNRASTSFQVTLSGVPTSGDYVLWHINSKISASGFTPFEGTGIEITPVGADYSFAVADYIGKTEVAAISGDLQRQIQSYLFDAQSMDNPVTSDWVVNALAPVTTHPTNTGINVRAFSTTVEEGAGLMLELPDNATNLSFTFTSCGATAGGGGVVPKIYTRYLRNDAAISSWSAGITGGTFTMPASTAFRKDSFTLSASALGVSGGDTIFVELTRDATNTADTLAVDWLLQKLRIGIS